MKMVRYVGRTQCIDPAYERALDSGRATLIDWVSTKPNSTVSFDLDGKPLAPRLRGTTLDFLDLGALVYLADEMVKRGEAQDYWTRTIRCLVPVTDVATWQDNTGLLAKTLEVLSGDLWQFEWVPLSAPRPVSRHRRRFPLGFDVVCLFSGGTDSLLGAVQLLREGKKVVLVGHQSEGQTAAAQKEMAAKLGCMFPGKTCLVQCRVSRSTRKSPEFQLAPKVEISHRPRSFLFLALGVAVAVQCRARELFMPENGFMALNIPLQKSRTGALSTRTAHPSYMLKFADLAHRITGFDGHIRNPFLTQSKTDMLRGLDPGLRDLVLRSVSCARPSRFNDRGVRHCGYCVPCIHRRAALLEAGIDSPSEYAFDAFGKFSSLDADKQQDLRAVVQFAARVAEASPTELQTLVLSHGHFPATVGSQIGISETTDYSPWTDMVRSWSRDLLAKLETVASVSTRRALGMHVRVRRTSR